MRTSHIFFQESYSKTIDFNVVTHAYLCVNPGTCYIPAKPLHNRDIVSVYFNNFHCMRICDKLSRHLSMLTYIYLNVDEC